MLKDEEIRNHTKLNDSRQIDHMAFARDIERAVLAKAGEQEPIYMWQMDGDEGWIVCKREWFDDIQHTNATRIVYAHPLPAQAIPEGYALVPLEPSPEQQAAGAQAIRMDTTVINKMFTANRVYRDMLSASPKPSNS